MKLSKSEKYLADLVSFRKVCPRCGKPTTTKAIEMKTKIKVVQRHFCPYFNGWCQVTASYKRKKKNDG